eukprot:UN11306
MYGEIEIKQEPRYIFEKKYNKYNKSTQNYKKTWRSNKNYNTYNTKNENDISYNTSNNSNYFRNKKNNDFEIRANIDTVGRNIVNTTSDNGINKKNRNT